jgi:hypothetical protein
VVGVVEDHALRPPQRQHGGAHVHERGTRADLSAEAARELGVTERRRDPRDPQLKGDVEHHVAPGFGLEPARAVAEPAVGAHEGPLHAVHPIERADPRDDVGDLLPVGAHVLHGRGAH